MISIVIKDRSVVSENSTPSEISQPEPHWNSSDGNASLYLGDALEILESIPDDSIHCIWTDPPYNLSNDGITCVGGKMVPVNKGEWDRSQGIDADHEFNMLWTKECYRVLHPEGTIWVTGTLHVHPSVGMALIKNNFRLLNDIIWVKTNPPPNLGRRTFTHSSELIYWASKAAKGGKHKHKFNYELMKSENGGKQMKSVWTFNAASRQEKRHGKHPTQKPVDLIARCLRASTDEGDIVLDPFAGSGSTGVAAVGLGRNFIGIEKEHEYISVAINRLTEIPATPPPHRQMAEILQLVLYWRNAVRNLPKARDCIVGNQRRKVAEWTGTSPLLFSRSWKATTCGNLQMNWGLRCLRTDG